VHTGGVHRWAASIVRDRLAEDPSPTEDELAKPGTRDPIEWFREGHIDLVATFDGWLVTFTPDGIKSVPGADDAECTVSGTASDVYLWLWHRPANVQISGEPAVADLWQAVRVRWS
jgi:hypothetical protein